jgi:hypothetical protein
VLIAAKNVKFHSSRIQADQSTAESAGQKDETNGEDSKQLSFFNYAIEIK